jgi:hypothetical protein
VLPKLVLPMMTFTQDIAATIADLASKPKHATAA